MRSLSEANDTTSPPVQSAPSENDAGGVPDAAFEEQYRLARERWAAGLLEDAVNAAWRAYDVAPHVRRERARAARNITGNPHQRCISSQAAGFPRILHAQLCGLGDARRSSTV